MRTRSIRGAVIALLTLSSLTVAAPPRINSSRAAGTGSAPLHRCFNTQLSITPVRSNGGAGHMGAMYRVHNLTRHACTLESYPGAELLDKRFHSLPTTVGRGLGNLLGERPVRPVRLTGSSNAYFVLEWSQIPIGNLPCRSARYVLVIPPDDKLPDVTYGFPGGGFIRVCSPQVTVSPVASTSFHF